MEFLFVRIELTLQLRCPVKYKLSYLVLSDLSTYSTYIVAIFQCISGPPSALVEDEKDL